jgi:DNA-binding XRE family transcriptional regulator
MGDFSTLPNSVTRHIKELGRRIRLARMRRKLIIVELAAKAGIDRNTLGTLELGKPGVSFNAYNTPVIACSSRPTVPPTSVPLMRMYCKSLPISSSIFLPTSRASQLRNTSVIRADT